MAIVAVTALAFESRIARGPGVSVLCHHATELSAALTAAIKRGVSGIISFGIAGGLAPNLAAGDWLIASAVRNGKETITTDHLWTRRLIEQLPGAIQAELVGVDTLMLDPSVRRAFHRQVGGTAVDMESHIAAKVAAEHGIPFAACRVIANAAHRRLPPAATVGVRRDGTPDVLSVLRSVRKEPKQLADLLRLAIDTRTARRALHAARQKLGLRFAFPYHREAAHDHMLPAIPAYQPS
jgi:hopanoid-associated phosphorylase